jgi:hypothetical protein
MSELARRRNSPNSVLKITVAANNPASHPHRSPPVVMVNGTMSVANAKLKQAIASSPINRTFQKGIRGSCK